MSGPGVGVLKNRANQTVYAILAAICFCHFLNDMTQSMIAACYPLFKGLYHLDYSQIGLITLTYQMTASLLQPVVGFYTDRRPQPFSLPVGMGFTLVGLVLLSRAGKLACDSVFLRAGWCRVIDFSSRVVASGPYGFGWTAWSGAVVFPGGRQYRLGDWPSVGGLYRCAQRTAQYRVVFHRAYCFQSWC